MGILQTNKWLKTSKNFYLTFFFLCVCTHAHAYVNKHINLKEKLMNTHISLC